MKSIFESEGALRTVEGHKPLLLNGAHGVWLVHSGSLDIFGIQMRKGEFAGPRIHVFRAEMDQVLFGTEEGSVEEGFVLLAVGAPGTLVLELGFQRFHDMILDPVYAGAADAAINAWVTGLSSGVRREIPPKQYEELEAAKEISISESANIRAATGTLWVKLLEGSSRFMGREALPSIDEGYGFIPLSSQAWLESAGMARCLALDTPAYALEESPLRGLDRFHGLILDCIALNSRETEAEELRRVELRAASDSVALENALYGLSSVLKPAEMVYVPEEGKEDILLAACRLVGNRAGIGLKAPAKEAMAGQDPISTIMRASGARMRQVVLKGEWWRQDNGPILGYMEEDKRPVALLPSSPQSYEIHDPSTRTKTEVTSAVVDSLSPFAYTFYRPLPDRVLNAWDLCKIGVHGCKKDLWTVLCMTMLLTILGMITPVATGIIFGTIIPDAARSQLAQMAVILTASAISISIFEITKSVALLRIESRVDASLQAGFMDRLLSLPTSFFRNYAAGDLTDRVMGINSIRTVLSGVTMHTILSAVFSFSNCVLLFWYDWKLALVAMAMTGVGVAFIAIVSIFQIRYLRTITWMQGKISGLVLELIMGVSKLRLSGTENRAFAVWSGAFSEQRRIAFKAGKTLSAGMTFNAGFPVLSSMAIFAWVAMKDMGSLSTGHFLAFNSAYINLQTAVLQVGHAMMAISLAIPLYERAKPIIAAIPEADVAKKPPGELSGDIEVSHVSFRYSPDGPLVLDSVSIHAKAGEFIALVGSSGSGKSTLLRLLLGFEAPETGTIYYDGQDLSNLDIREVRHQVGVVLQNGQVMAGEMFKNIVGSSNLTLEDAWEAARMAGLDDTIQQMPMGMHTVLTPGGSTLSGGQRQRLMIARAIVHKPRILFFDEATSALDNRTQAIVSRSLEKLQTTRIVIAHRLSTVMNADSIYVLERGRLVQSGSYEELIAVKGPFAELAKRQIA